jgi:hypothetical protein
MHTRVYVFACLAGDYLDQKLTSPRILSTTQLFGMDHAKSLKLKTGILI